MTAISGGNLPFGNASENPLAAMFTQGRCTELETIARTVTENSPESGYAWKVLGAVLLRRGAPVQALEAMQRAAQLLPVDAESHNNLGVAHQRLGRRAEAETCFRRALSLVPRYAEAHNNLGGGAPGTGALYGGRGGDAPRSRTKSGGRRGPQQSG